MQCMVLSVMEWLEEERLGTREPVMREQAPRIYASGPLTGRGGGVSESNIRSRQNANYLPGTPPHSLCVKIQFRLVAWTGTNTL